MGEKQRDASQEKWAQGDRPLKLVMERWSVEAACIACSLKAAGDELYRSEKKGHVRWGLTTLQAAELANKLQDELCCASIESDPNLWIQPGYAFRIYADPDLEGAPEDGE